MNMHILHNRSVFEEYLPPDAFDLAPIISTMLNENFHFKLFGLTERRISI